MCKYKSDKPSAACGTVFKVGCTKDEINTLVMLHNNVRRDIASGKIRSQPRAVPMTPLVWDNDLAQIAQRWANQCQPGLDECRYVDGVYIGQNVGDDMDTRGDINQAYLLQKWYDEILNLKSKEVSKFTGKKLYKVDHYTQLVWANTKKVGCGCIKHLTSDSDGYDMFMTRLVCNYSPGGNVIGEPVYKIKK